MLNGPSLEVVPADGGHLYSALSLVGHGRTAYAKWQDKFLVELEQNETGLGIHPLNDFLVWHPSPRAELDNDSWARKIEAPRGLPRQKR